MDVTERCKWDNLMVDLNWGIRKALDEPDNQLVEQLSNALAGIDKKVYPEKYCYYPMPMWPYTPELNWVEWQDTGTVIINPYGDRPACTHKVGND